jgi:hypothetical protein
LCVLLYDVHDSKHDWFYILVGFCRLYGS